ncbi:MAG: hypothetical protein SGILL_007816, partial [Bacillariaceae sp.]
MKRVVHDSEQSENNTQQLLNFNDEGTMVIDYWVEQREIWGGYVTYESVPPGRAYYNLSKADAVSLDYSIISPLSAPGRGHFRFILFDGSDCEDCSTFNTHNYENYYSFHYILEDDHEQGSIVVELEGGTDSLSPFWNPGWSGIEGNRKLDRDMIRGVNLQIVIDYNGEIGSFMEGSIELRNMRALESYNATETDLSQCIVEPELRFVTPEQFFRRIEFLGYHRCCETCQANPSCNIALHDGKDCYIGEYVEREHVRLVNSGFGKNSFTVFWKDTLEARGEICDVCDCDTKARTIDCRGKDLVLPPVSLDTHLWGPKVLDLRDNPRLLLLGTKAFANLETIEELRLPSNLTYLSSDVLNCLENLQKATYEDESEAEMVVNVISSKEDSFGEVCCSIGSSREVQAGSDESWSFCDMEIDQPGIDAVYEDYIQYFSPETLNLIIPSSPLFSEAAESAEKCAEYCSILEECRYFAYDGRSPNAFPVCRHFNYVESEQTVCCHPEHYQDANMTLPGWISGRVPRTRCDVDDARVYVTSKDVLTLSEDNGFETEYFVHLGSQPLRGAVWIEPKVLSNAGMEFYTVPSRVVLYDNETIATVKVVGEGTGSVLSKSLTITITNEVTACDAAFSTSDSCVSPDDLAVYVEVIPPNKSTRTILVAFFAVFTALSLIAVAVFLSADHKRRKADQVWQISPDELEFKDPPQVLGRGTFGKVLLAEYRGTHVAVKQVIPPRSIFEQTDSSSASFSRNDNDIESGVESALPLSKPPESELSSLLKGIQTIRNKASKRNWNAGTISPFHRDEYALLKTQFIDEMRYLSKLRHPNVTTVMGAVVDRDDPKLVMELMTHGSLYDLLHNETIQLDGEQILPILRDITSGLRFLHAAEPQVIHGDLKASNILVDDRFRAKVSDFGLTQKQRLGAAGTPYWTAPEVILGQTSNTAESDVYAFGIILYELYSRKHPYEGEQFETVLREVCDPEINKRPTLPEGSCPVEIQAMMADCLDTDPTKRPTFEELDLRLKKLDVDSVHPGGLVQSLRQQQSDDESLLFEVFPPHIARALREGRRVEPEHKDMVTLFFCDIVGFTSISETMEPMKVANMLDRLYLKFDALSRAHNVHKVETVGDCWMGATNL